MVKLEQPERFLMNRVDTVSEDSNSSGNSELSAGLHVTADEYLNLYSGSLPIDTLQIKQSLLYFTERTKIHHQAPATEF